MQIFDHVLATLNPRVKDELATSWEDLLDQLEDTGAEISKSFFQIVNIE